jgi:hypothetical protein
MMAALLVRSSNTDWNCAPEPGMPERPVNEVEHVTEVAVPCRAGAAGS